MVPSPHMNFLRALAVDLCPSRAVLGFLVGCACFVGLTQADELKLDAQLQPSPVQASATPVKEDDPVGEFLQSRDQPPPRLVTDTALSVPVVAQPAQALAPPSATAPQAPVASKLPAAVAADTSPQAAVPALTNSTANKDSLPQADATKASVVAVSPKSPTDADAPLGVGDQIAITVFGQPDLSAEVTVGDSGMIMVPLVGTLGVLNQTAAQLENLVARRLKDGGYLQNPGVSVQVRQLRSQLISVMGEVQRPGRYPIQGRMTVLEALATAGGLTPRADRQVLLLRKTKAPHANQTQPAREEIRIPLDVSNGTVAGQMDAVLLNEDVILVGVQKQFYVHGEVRRPGAYPMEPGMNVMKAISIGGGITERGSSRRITIHRQKEGQGTKELPAPLTAPVLSDDVIHVDERLF